MKHVYRAYDERLQRHVAIKVLRGVARDEGERGRIRDEALVLSRLSHANVEIVHDFDSQDGIDFLVTEFIQGETLDRRIGSRPLPERDVIALGCQIADALGAAHSKRIVHRDLKPANIIVTTEGVVKVLDFGIAKMAAADETTHTWTSGHPSRGVMYTDPRGTLPYMAPEALLEGRVDARTDLYALGVVLFEMVTGRRPFQQDRPTALVREICTTRPPNPSSLNPRVSRRLEELIVKCLEKKAELRYQSALEVRVDLLRAESGPVPSEVLPARAGRGGRLAAWLKGTRWPWVVAASAGAALVLWTVTRQPVPTPVLPQRQLTHVTAAVSPALSPDGSYFAFVDQSEPDHHKVLVQSVAGGEAREVFSSSFCNGLRWSPDGSRLLCLAARTSTEIPRAHLVPWPGGEVRTFDSFGMVGAWAPDGRSFATALFSERMLYITDAATGARSSYQVGGDLSSVRDVDWSPRGDLIAVLSMNKRGNSTIWTMTPDGKEVRSILADSLELGAPRFTPDGRGMFLLKSNQESWDILKIDLGSRRGRQRPNVLLSGVQMDPSITISRDGRTLLYARASTRQNLWSVDVRRARGPDAVWSARPLTTGAFVEAQPRFSPDGGEIVFTRAEGMASEIFVTSANGGTPRRLTYLDVRTGDPAWSPDGREVAFCSNVGGRSRVHRVGRSGGPVRVWDGTNASERWLGLAWAPNDSVLYLAPNNRNYRLLDPVSGGERQLLLKDSSGDLLQPRLSPDGARVATMWNSWPSMAVWVVSLDGSWVRATEGGPMVPMDWAPDGRSLFLLDVNHRPTRILRHDTRTGGSREYLRFPPGDRVLDGAFSPSGDQLVYAVRTSESNVWLIDGLDPR